MKKRALGSVSLRCLVAILAAGSATSPAKAQSVLWQWEGEFEGDSFGASVGGAGDVDGDGFPDILVGAPYNDDAGTQAGKVYLFSGGTGELLAAFVGEDWLDNMRTVAGLGDLDGDGLADFLVATPRGAGSCGSEQGRVDLFLDMASPEQSFFGETCGDRFGSELAGLGDIDGDEVPDFIIGAPQRAPLGYTNLGEIYVYSGQTLELLYNYLGQESGDNLGTNVAPAGDFNADGYADFIASSYQGTDEVYVFSGKDGSLLHTFVAVLGERGIHATGVGDIDGDGYGDVLIGAPRFLDLQGKAYLYSGRTQQVVEEYQGTVESEFGLRVGGVGDANLDGVPDFLIGASKSVELGDNTGSAFLYSGRSKRLLYKFVGAGYYDIFGSDIAGAGDVNGDGCMDILIGALGHYVDGVPKGAAYVFAGNDLFLQAGDNTVTQGDTLQLYTRGGQPGNLAYLVIREINGLPAPFNILGVGTLDVWGEWTFEVAVPPGLAGFEFGIRSYSRRTRVVNPNASPPGAPFLAKAPPSREREVVLADSGLEMVVVE